MSDLITDHESRKPKMAFPGEQEEELLRFQHCGYANWQQLGCRRRRWPPAWVESKAVLQEVVGNPSLWQRCQGGAAAGAALSSIELQRRLQGIYAYVF